MATAFDKACERLGSVELNSSGILWRSLRLVPPQRANAASDEDASVLDHARFLAAVSVRLRSPSQNDPTDEVSFRRLQNFAICTNVTLHCNCEVEYTGPDTEDVVVKIFKGAYPEHLQSFEYVGHIHSMQGGKRVVQLTANRSSYFLGFEFLVGLNKERSKADLRQCLPLLHDFQGNSRPDQSDFLVVFCSRDAGKNTTWMRHLRSMGPRSGPWEEKERTVAFCTDISLGIGQHFCIGVDLNLGKHGFGLPQVAEGDDAWFQEFSAHARLVRYGVLLINVSPHFFRSRAVYQELFGVDDERLYVYQHVEDRIVPARQYRAMLEEAVHPVIAASLQGDHDQIVNALRDDVDFATLAVDRYGHSSLAVAAMKGMHDTIGEILHHGANVELKNYVGATPLHIAAGHGQLEAATVLIQSKANVNSRDDHLGYTPLHEASHVGHAALVSLLLEARAHHLQKDARGRKPSDVAMELGHVDITNLIQNASLGLN